MPRLPPHQMRLGQPRSFCLRPETQHSRRADDRNTDPASDVADEEPERLLVPDCLFVSRNRHALEERASLARPSLPLLAKR